MDWREKKALGLTPPEPTAEEQERFMGEALKEARLAYEAGEVPIGAVVVRDGEVVGRGHNRRESDKNALAHAEVLAIDEACKALGGWRLWECDLYVTLEPCPMCAGALVNARVRNVYYGAKDEKAGSIESVTKLFDLPYNHRPKAYGGVRKEECAALLSEFFEVLRGKRTSRNEV
ncbi:MAG: nucleoside deaminase [Clostridia bacterium]|nr:nucleoside deaminase [Clostridia bacterium]